jgi:osmotically-inducible protein OsmY
MLGLQMSKTFKKNNQILFISCLVLISLNSCMAPLVVGGGAVVAGTASREKRIGSSISDTQISNEIKKIFQKNNVEMHDRINVNVQNGEVLLTGMVNNESWKNEAVTIASSVPDVKEVHDYIEVGNLEGITNLVKDSWITSNAKSKLMVLSDVHSLNFQVKTVNNVIYLTGIAQNQAELDKVTKALQDIGGVRKIVSLVRTKEEIGLVED